jgi:hypothetical protein
MPELSTSETNQQLATNQHDFGLSPPCDESLADIPHLEDRRRLDVIPILLGERIDGLFSFPLFALRQTLVLPAKVRHTVKTLIRIWQIPQ